MEDGVAKSETKSEKMGATNNSNTARLAVLQDRRKYIEETLAKRNQELRQLCIQEAELTGITPPEMPLEAGETPPTIRRRIGTAFQLNENLLNNNNKDQLIADLELQIQVHMNLAEAALGLANEASMSKTVKRQHRAEYQKHKAQCIALKEKLTILKDKAASEQTKLKKKPRVPEPQDDNISIITNEPYPKPEIRQSQMSSKHSLTMLSPTDTYPEPRYPTGISRHHHRHSENPYIQYGKPDDVATSGFFRLSLNGYNDYIERHENNNIHYNYPSQTLPYNYAHTSHSQPLHIGQHYSQQHSPLMSQNSPEISPHLSQSSPHIKQHSPHMSQHSSLSQHSPMSQHSSHWQAHSPQLSHSPLSQHSVIIQRASQTHSLVGHRASHDFGGKYSLPNAQMHGQSSPTGNSVNKVQYYPSHTIHGEPGYSRYTMESGGYRNTVDGGVFRNPHQIQPHQQYEHNGLNSAGLGGCWKRSENGEMFWCYSNTIDSNWQRDKRFGSLDRRKNKRIQRRISPVENKAATLSTLPPHNDQVKTAFVKPSQITNRRSQDQRQLVRTQSLGSVGQAIDSVYPSDDTSSCGSGDNRSLKENRGVRKHKEKEWLETSLDGPISPTHSISSRPQSTVPSIIAPEEQYVIYTPPLPPHHQIPRNASPILPQNLPQSPLHHIPQVSSPLSPKPPLEIPAESHPSPHVPEPPYIELLNNNIPKNCTVVQAGGCRPYHEETKPFEMADFYKYSTKFKKSPQKDGGKGVGFSQTGGAASQRSLNNNFDEVDCSSRFQGSQPVQIQQFVHSSGSTVVTRDSSCNLNTSLDLSQITVSEHFSEEMNAWYNQQDHPNENNTNTSKSRSNATLV